MDKELQDFMEFNNESSVSEITFAPNNIWHQGNKYIFTLYIQKENLQDFVLDYKIGVTVNGTKFESVSH